MNSLAKRPTLATAINDLTRKDIIFPDYPMRLGEDVKALGREDGIVDYIYPNCPTEFYQWVGAIVIDDRLIEPS